MGPAPLQDALAVSIFVVSALVEDDIVCVCESGVLVRTGWMLCNRRQQSVCDMAVVMGR